MTGPRKATLLRGVPLAAFAALGWLAAPHHFFGLSGSGVALIAGALAVVAAFASRRR